MEDNVLRPRSLGASKPRNLDASEPADDCTRTLGVGANRKILGVAGISDGVPADYQVTTEPLSSLSLPTYSLKIYL